jgi:hypothetical protein
MACRVPSRSERSIKSLALVSSGRAQAMSPAPHSNRLEILNDAADCAMLEDKPWISGNLSSFSP